MNRALFALGAMVLVVVSIHWSLAAPQAAPPPEMGIGRYALVRGTGDVELYVIDTSTGQVWFQAKGSSEWRREGNPAPTAK